MVFIAGAAVIEDGRNLPFLALVRDEPYDLSGCTILNAPDQIQRPKFKSINLTAY